MFFRRKRTANKPIKDGNYRVIKISEDALFEFIYEEFIDGQNCYMDLQSEKVKNTFTIDWESRSFIFIAYNSDDKNGNIVKFSEKIDLDKLMKKLPDTTDTMYAGGRYKDYSEEQLLDIQEG